MPDIDIEDITPSAPDASDRALVRRGSSAPFTMALTEFPAGGSGVPVPTSLGTSNQTAMSNSQAFTFTVTGGTNEVYPAVATGCAFLIRSAQRNDTVLMAGQTYQVSGNSGIWNTGTTNCSIIVNGRKEDFTVTLSGGPPI